MNLLFYQSLKTIPFGVAVAIKFSGPLAVACFGSRRRMDCVWIALAIAGLGLPLPLGHDVSELNPVGVGYALAAAVCWATHIVFGKRVGHLYAGHSVALGLSVAAVSSATPSLWKWWPSNLDERLTELQWLAIALVMCAAAGSAATQTPETHRGPAGEIVQ